MLQNIDQVDRSSLSTCIYFVNLNIKIKDELIHLIHLKRTSEAIRHCLAPLI